jgi:hypothetical protein
MDANTIVARTVLAVASLAVVCGPASAGAEEVQHVRPASAAARQLIEQAPRYSATLKDLIDRIQLSDVIVYVQITGSPQIPTAATTLVATTPGRRYLRVLINAANPAWSRAQLLAHELQHVLEIASDPEVTSDEAVRKLYRRIGRSAGRIDHFETVAAQTVEAIVRKEMARFGK